MAGIGFGDFLSGALGGLGGGAASGLVSGVLGSLFGPSLEDQTNESIRRDNVNNANDFLKFMAQRQAADPHADVKSLIGGRALANKLGLKRATGVDLQGMRPGTNPQGTGSFDPTVNDPQLQAIQATLRDTGKSNLNMNANTGLLDSVTPKFNPVDKIPAGGVGGPAPQAQPKSNPKFKDFMNGMF